MANNQVASKNRLGLPAAVLFFGSLAVWGLTPPVILLMLFVSPSEFLRTQKMWGYAAIGWSLASLVLFILMLAGGYRRGRSVRVFQGVLGLTCTLALGLPAIVLGTLPLFGSPIDFLQSISSGGSDVTLGDLKTSNRDGDAPTMYLVGIDLSSSFVAGQGDKDRLDMIYGTLDSFFISARNDSFANSLSPRDAILYFVFAGKSKSIADNVGQGIFGMETKRLKPSEDLPDLLNAYLTGNDEEGVRQNNNLKRGSTDLLGFFDEGICGQIHDRAQNFSSVKVIVFTDLIQSGAPEGNRGRSELSQERAAKLEKVKACIKDGPADVSVTSFWLKPHGGKEEELGGDELDVSRYFSLQLPPKYWREVDLEKYAGADMDEKSLMCESLYAKVVPLDETLYLKYLPGPDLTPVISRLVFPKTSPGDRLFLELRSMNGAAPVRIRFGKEWPKDFVLGLGSRESSFASIGEDSVDQRSVPVAVERDPETPRNAHYELRVAIPRRSILYKIPIAVIQVMPASTIGIFKFVLMILHLFPLALAATIAWEVLRRRVLVRANEEREDGSSAQPAPRKLLQ